VDYVAENIIDILCLVSFVSRTALRLATGQIIGCNMETTTTL
jgi:hypothetical protein